MRDPEKALSLARRAVDKAPENAAYRNTLGVALYRAGRFAEAVEVLEANAKEEHANVVHDWLFLAMSHHRLGHAKEAREYRDRAVQWRRLQERPDAVLAAEFDAFRTEVEANLAGPPGR